MKNVMLLTFALLIGACSSLSAQTLTIGVKGGFSIPNLTGGGTENPLNSSYSSSLGSDYGVYEEYRLTNLLSISIGAESSSQGGKKNGFQAFTTPASMASQLPVNTTYLYANFKNESKLNYLLIPVLARFNWSLGQKSPFKVYAAVGPFAGFLLNAHQVTDGSSIIYMDAEGQIPITAEAQSFNNTTNIKDQLHTFNTGIDGFIGISYVLSPKHALFIEGGGNFGFIPIQKVADDGKNYTGAGVVTLGYAYSL